MSVRLFNNSDFMFVWKLDMLLAAIEKSILDKQATRF